MFNMKALILKSNDQFKKVKLQGQGHGVKNNGSHSTSIFIQQIGARMSIPPPKT